MEAKRPNFLVLVADDLGFSDSQPYGSEIRTPNINKLAEAGLRLTDFHTAPTCSPTRSMLFSGTDNHIAGLGTMAEAKQDYAPGLFDGKPGYEGYLNFRVAALSEILQEGGYRTFMAGKWHLGMEAELSPAARGFDRSFTLLPGAGNHHAWMPDLDEAAKKHCPPFIGGENFYMEDGRFLDAPRELPKDYFSTRTFTDKILTYLNEWNVRDDRDQTPFFGYVAYTAPHWPLQAKPETVASYAGRYDQGPEHLRDQRLRGLVQQGLVPEGVEPHPMDAKSLPWQALSAEQKKAEAHKMEIYAAMVEEMDTQIGRIIAELEAMGELDNTFVLFMSDNGAEGTMMEAKPASGSSMTHVMKLIEDYFDNRVENMGRKNSFVVYGPRWALAATAPSRGFKSMTSEGGIRCPCILRYPGFARTTGGSISHEFMNVMDICPTLLSMAGIAHPHPQFRSRPVAALRGKDWSPYLSSRQDAVYDEKVDVTGWELFGQRGIRRGPYKALFIPPPKGSGKWELYHLKDDPGEMHDLSEKEPVLMAEMMAEWTKYLAETGLVDMMPHHPEDW